MPCLSVAPTVSSGPLPAAEWQPGWGVGWRLFQGFEHDRHIVDGRVGAPLRAPLIEAGDLCIKVGNRITVELCQGQPAQQVAAALVDGVGQICGGQLHEQLPDHVVVVFLVLVAQQWMGGDPLLQAVDQFATHGQRVSAKQVQLGSLLVGGVLKNVILMLGQKSQCFLGLLMNAAGQCQCGTAV